MINFPPFLYFSLFLFLSFSFFPLYFLLSLLITHVFLSFPLLRSRLHLSFSYPVLCMNLLSLSIARHAMDPDTDGALIRQVTLPSDPGQDGSHERSKVKGHRVTLSRVRSRWHSLPRRLFFFLFSFVIFHFPSFSPSGNGQKVRIKDD